MSPPVTTRRFLVVAAIAMGCVTACELGGCNVAARRATQTVNVYPPPPQAARAVALGNLRGAPAVSKAATDIAVFLFGTEPPPPLTIANPVDVAAADGVLLVCDNTLGALFRWDSSGGVLVEECCDPRLDFPFALDIAPNGERLLCHRGGVQRFSPTGSPLATYRADGFALKPGGVLAVEDQVWVTNLAMHRIEVFDFNSGAYLRSIGTLGMGPGQFSLPRGLARGPEGHVYVVDMLNNRVQVLRPDGTFVRSMGSAGNVAGTFGRPRDVAVGPDGTTFVTDSFSQRVHAFDPDGRPLLAFGEPGSGIGALALPGGISVSPIAPFGSRAPADEPTPAYYILVGEQLDQPGVRVYGWLPPRTDEQRAIPEPPASNWRPAFPGSVALNPHWQPDRCTTCHEQREGQMQPIPPATVDRLCVSCHDGTRAPADPHPIGRPANSEGVTTPEGWPAHNGTIGCMTCHDIIRHCDRNAQRPAVNSVLLRGFDPQRSLEYCSICHRSDVGGRFSPHRQRDSTGRVRDDACFFCHTLRPEIPTDGKRQFAPYLRDESSAICLNCHPRHWDLSPEGHVDRPVTPRIRQWMIMRELRERYIAGPEELARLAAESGRSPARLPLGNNRVTCYSCHNPHYAGLFPEDSELGALADNPADRRAALRTDWIDLCSECHHH